jgi:hypothetical protein
VFAASVTVTHHGHGSVPPSLDFLISVHNLKKNLNRAESAELRPRTTTPDAYLQMRNHFVTVEGKHTRNASMGAYKQALLAI